MAAPAPDAVLHLAALHALAAAGFASTSRAASLALSDTLARYLRVVALACTDRAALAGRSKVAAVDVLQALEQLGVGGIGELHEWAVQLDQAVCFTAPGLSTLSHVAREGIADEQPIAHLTLVPDSQLPNDVFDDEGDEDEGKGNEDEGKGNDNDDDEQGHMAVDKTPDLSWLPPLPGSSIPDGPSSHPEPTPTALASAPTPTTSAANLGIIDRYRRRTPFSQSQLAAAHDFVDPLLSTPAPSPSALPPHPTSFPCLAAAFAATKGEPTVALRFTPLRQQASELLRRTIASPDEYSPQDTLHVSLAAPRSTPIIPSHSETIPANFLPLNPAPDGVLARLVHQMHSPHLPPALRERLTSIRPPKPLVRDGQPLLYGEPVRGPSQAALARARGKPQEAEEADQGLVRATWPSVPHGVEKWGRGKLPSGKKVVQGRDGEDQPRRKEAPTKLRTLATATSPGGAGAGGPPLGASTQSGTGKITLRLGGPLDGTASQPPTPGGTPGGPSSALAPSHPPTPATSPGPTGIKLKLGGGSSPANTSSDTGPKQDTRTSTDNGTFLQPLAPRRPSTEEPSQGPSLSPAPPTAIRFRLPFSALSPVAPAPTEPQPAHTNGSHTPMDIDRKP